MYCLNKAFYQRETGMHCYLKVATRKQDNSVNQYCFNIYCKMKIKQIVTVSCITQLNKV